MHGLVNLALQRFVEDTWEPALWVDTAEAIRSGLSSVDALLTYDDGLTDKLVDGLAERTGLPREMLLEDLGTYLVSAERTQPLRRLLRFGGETFTDFLYSLDDLSDRARLAVSDLQLPALDLIEHAPGHFTLSTGPGLRGYGHVLAGVLRALADDYGSLAVVELLTCADEGARLTISVADAAFSEGRGFDLAPARMSA